MKNCKVSTNKHDEGFILLESLVSLSILAFFVGGVVPFLLGLFTLRDQTKTDVELHRYLYENALFWDRRVETKERSPSNSVEAVVRQTSHSITVIHEEEIGAALEIVSVDWRE